MLTWLSQNIATIVIIAVLAVIFGLMIYSLIRDKKAGKSSCCGGCAGCANACYCHGHTAPKSDETTADSSPEAQTPPSKGDN